MVTTQHVAALMVRDPPHWPGSSSSACPCLSPPSSVTQRGTPLSLPAAWTLTYPHTVVTEYMCNLSVLCACGVDSQPPLEGGRVLRLPVQSRVGWVTPTPTAAGAAALLVLEGKVERGLHMSH